MFGKGGAVANANTILNTENSNEIRSRRNAGVFGEGGTVDEEEDLLYRGRPQVGYVAKFYLEIILGDHNDDHVSLVHHFHLIQGKRGSQKGFLQS